MEIVFRVQRLRQQPDRSIVRSGRRGDEPAHRRRTPRAGRHHDRDRLPRPGRSRRRARRGDGGPEAEYAIEVTYEGLYELAEETLADGSSTLLDEHFGALGGWIAATLVKLGDLKLEFLPADDGEA